MPGLNPGTRGRREEAADDTTGTNTSLVILLIKSNKHDRSKTAQEAYSDGLAVAGWELR